MTRWYVSWRNIWCCCSLSKVVVLSRITTTNCSTVLLLVPTVDSTLDRVRRGDDLKGGYELAELKVLSEPNTQLQGSALLLQHKAAARETLKSLFCLPSVLSSLKKDLL